MQKLLQFVMYLKIKLTTCAASIFIEENRVFYEPKVLKKATLYVVRTDSNNNYINSAPCKDCYSIISNLFIKNIIFSSNINEFIKYKTEDYSTEHISNGNRFLNNKNLK